MIFSMNKSSNKFTKFQQLRIFIVFFLFSVLSYLYVSLESAILYSPIISHNLGIRVNDNLNIIFFFLKTC